MDKNIAMSDLDISSFCKQMSEMLHAGISMNEALSVLSSNDDAVGFAAGKILSLYSVSFDIKDAILKSGMMPEYAVELIGIGIETGKCDEVMGRLEKHYEKEHRFKETMVNSIVKPAIMMCIALAFTSVIVLCIFPVFIQVSEQTGIIKDTKEWMVLHYGYIICNITAYTIMTVILLLMIALILYNTVRGKALLQKILIHIKWVQNVIIYISLSKFFGIVYIMSSSGVSYVQSMETAAQIVSSPLISDKIYACIEKLEDGNDIKEVLLDSGIMDKKYAKITEIGFMTGNFEKSMSEVSGKYMYDASCMLYHAASVMENLSSIFLPVMSGFVILSAILPLMGIFSGI